MFSNIKQRKECGIGMFELAMSTQNSVAAKVN